MENIKSHITLDATKANNGLSGLPSGLIWVFFMIPAIYKFTNKVNGKIYIGQSKDITTRLRAHLTGRGSKSMQPDVDLYGWGSFRFEILEFIDECDNLLSILDEREQYFIDIHIKMGLNFNTEFYNKELFVDGHDKKVSEGTRKRQSDTRKGMLLSREHIESVRRASIERDTIQNVKGKRPSSEAISQGLRKISKHVLQYDLDGNFIKEHETQVDAASYIGMPKHEYNINKALKGVVYQAYDFQWRYKTDNYPTKIPSILRRVKVLDYNKNLISVCNNPIDAANLLGIHVNRVIYALNNGKYNYSAGYYFFYVNEHGDTL